MTKADLDAMAAAIKAAYLDYGAATPERTEDGAEVDGPALVRVVRRTRREAVQRVAIELADRLERHCSSFDVRQFFDSCGMESDARFLSAQLHKGRYAKKLAPRG